MFRQERIYTMLNNKQAIFDLGSNTLKCFVYEKKENNLLVKIYSKIVFTKTWEKIQNSTISDAEVDFLINVVSDLKNKALSLYPNIDFHGFATECFRSMGNGREIIQKISKSTDVPIKIISGEQEAEYNFQGVKAFYKENLTEGLIVDMGGGSTEFVYFENGKMKFKKSLKFGALKLKDKFCPNQIPGFSCLKKIKEEILTVVNKEVSRDYFKSDIIFVSGTFLVFAWILNGYKQLNLNNLTFEDKDIKHYLNMISSGKEEVIIEILREEKERKDVFGIALILAECINSIKTRGLLKICNWGLREGYLLSRIK